MGVYIILFFSVKVSWFLNIWLLDDEDYLEYKIFVICFFYVQFILHAHFYLWCVFVLVLVIFFVRYWFRCKKLNVKDTYDLKFIPAKIWNTLKCYNWSYFGLEHAAKTDTGGRNTAVTFNKTLQVFLRRTHV